MAGNNSSNPITLLTDDEFFNDDLPPTASKRHHKKSKTARIDSDSSDCPSVRSSRTSSSSSSDSSSTDDEVKSKSPMRKRLIVNRRKASRKARDGYLVLNRTDGQWYISDEEGSSRPLRDKIICEPFAPGLLKTNSSESSDSDSEPSSNSESSDNDESAPKKKLAFIEDECEEADSESGSSASSDDEDCVESVNKEFKLLPYMDMKIPDIDDEDDEPYCPIRGPWVDPAQCEDHDIYTNDPDYCSNRRADFICAHPIWVKECRAWREECPLTTLICIASKADKYIAAL